MSTIRASARPPDREIRPLLVEVVGPAGSGKTSVVRTLRSKDSRIRIGLGLGRRKYVWPLLLRVGPFVPVWLRRYRHDRWFDRRDIRSITFLDAWYRAIRRGRSRDELVVLFDHGPLYRLARLWEFGPPITRSEAFRRWWSAALEGWLSALDVVVWLDAPDDILLQRVGHRGHWYLSNGVSDEEKHRFLDRYRKALTEVVPVRPNAGPRVLRFQSEARSSDQIATEVLRAFSAIGGTHAS